jgi:hypothetical protein
VQDLIFIPHQISLRRCPDPSPCPLPHPTLQHKSRNGIEVEELAKVINGFDSGLDYIEELVDGLFMLKLLEILGHLVEVELSELRVCNCYLLSDERIPSQ